ncbi:uncharacterized protein FHS31_001696 [Sphingomonas vulcanisoli]|uniref:DUF418 domain-containing protein n=1 Tax=Sphingomonas vulcanisoli TaxID=1658060 RepID=A0ABX0TRD6_9SPHN|nr:DUF418 domain-containing protein [Sphingomonas vulcanisoli]NIJ08086.1 uncharacterized protein [Sphingomonas vulcanisoli]
MTEQATRSIAINERIDTLDLLRGVAICSILLMNIPDMGGIWEITRPPYPATWNIDWIAYGVQRFLFEGSMRGLFTLLFGSGMLVMLRKTERDGMAAPMDVFVRRCIALMFLGLVQFLIFLWPGEILYNYGMTGFFILAFRKAKPKTLLIVALTLLTLFSVAGSTQAFGIKSQIESAAKAEKLVAQHKPLTKDQQEAIDAKKKMDERRNPSAQFIADEVKQRTHLVSLIGWSAKTWWEDNTGAAGVFGCFESFIFMLIGMALFRMRILTGERGLGFYVRLALIGYGIGIPLRIVSNLLQWKMALGFDFFTVMFGGLTYEPGRLLVTLGHVGLLCSLFKAGALGRAWPARALGRMALTTYSLQSILTSILFYGFGMLNRFGFAGLMATAIGIWVITGVFAVLWLRSHQQGPAEWVLRRIAYGRRADGPTALSGPDGTLATA